MACSMRRSLISAASSGPASRRNKGVADALVLAADGLVSFGAGSTLTVPAVKACWLMVLGQGRLLYSTLPSCMHLWADAAGAGPKRPLDTATAAATTKATSTHIQTLFIPAFSLHGDLPAGINLKLRIRPPLRQTCAAKFARRHAISGLECAAEMAQIVEAIFERNDRPDHDACSDTAFLRTG